MSKFLSKAHKATGKFSVARNAMDALGVSKSSTARQLIDPAGSLREANQELLDTGDKDAYLAKLKSGDLTDPAGIFHSRGTPDTVEAPPEVTTALPEGIKARDRIRRQVYKAKGRRSTIRSSAPFSGYSSQPAALLGS
jgi:hypothetical protein